MKKKGLIVATIVMVLVLAVSLTTATYAWFSSQASATVDDLAITTKAADGLQIAMLNKSLTIDDLQSGELTYDAGNASAPWLGAQNAWGSYLGFAAVEQGEWENAVTYNTGEMTVYTGDYKVTSDGSAVPNKTYYKETEEYSAEDYPSSAPEKKVGVKYYTLSASVYTPVTGDTLAAATDYYTIAETVFATGVLEAVTDEITGTGFMVPTGYNSAIEPTGYQAATKNTHYYEFEMAITNTSAIYDLGMGIVITPTDTTVGSSTYPGMVAASRIELEFHKGLAAQQKTGTLKNSVGDATISTAIEPWGAWQLQSNNTMTSVPANGSVDGDYQIKLEESATPISAGTVWFVTVRIWIEGTDNECKNFTAGTGYTVEIEFVYTPDDETALTYNNEENSGTNAYYVTFA